jgi:putative endonuclease
MMEMFVYILRCSDGSFCIEVTNDLSSCMVEHHQGVNPGSYTCSGRPLELVCFRVFYSPREAIAFEKKIKRWSNPKKAALISKEFEKLHELAKCRNSSSHELYVKASQLPSK